MLNLSITPMKEDRIDEICEDIIAQQKNGVSTHAMFLMYFVPECTPPLQKAKAQCELYDKYRERLDRAGAKHGILVQSTLGHITPPREMYPFMPSVSLVTGEAKPSTCCPMDPGFHKYIKEQMKVLAQSKPSIVMIDDDLGLLYRDTKGCCCEHHLAEFNRRAGTNMTREQLYAHTQGNSEEDKYYTQIYVDTQRDGIVSAVKAMREGLDEVDKSIQGIVSGIYTSTFCEFSGDTAEAFAGEGNPRIIRLNGGPYAKPGSKYFTENMFRAAILRENVKDKVDIFLAETDTCPQNRYSTSAALLHGHFTGHIMEGAEGAKHWLTRTVAFEPASGKAYRKMLGKHAGFYEKMTEYTKELKPFGCRIPLTLMQNYGFVESERPIKLSPWSSNVLERLGLPLYFSNEKGGAVFLDGFSVDGFSDNEIKEYLSGTLILSSDAAEKLEKRGFSDLMGVKVSNWEGRKIKGEMVFGVTIAVQYGVKQLTPCMDGVKSLSDVYHLNTNTNEKEVLFPGVTRYENNLGGEVIVFSGTANMPFEYFTAFSLLCESRKKQFVEILSKRDNLPIYYTEDVEMYLRAGYLNSGEIMATFFNIGFDQLDEIPFACTKKVNKVEKLMPDGTREECEFVAEDGVIKVFERLETLMPAVLFIS